MEPEPLSDDVFVEYNESNDELVISTDGNAIVLTADAWAQLKSFAKRSIDL